MTYNRDTAMRRKILSDDPVALGKRIREARERAGFSTLKDFQNAVEHRGGNVSAEYLGQIERGVTKPSLAAMKMILDVCGVTMADVLGGDSMVREDATVLAARIKEVRERAGYKTPGQLWKAIHDRGGNITRQYLYQLEQGKNAASLNKLTMILEACGISMDEFLRTDLVIVSRGDSNIEERKLVTMLTTIRELNPALAGVVESTIHRAHSEAVKLNSERELGKATRNNRTEKPKKA